MGSNAITVCHSIRWFKYKLKPPEKDLECVQENEQRNISFFYFKTPVFPFKIKLNHRWHKISARSEANVEMAGMKTQCDIFNEMIATKEEIIWPGILKD